MPQSFSQAYTGFDGYRLIASGPIHMVALAFKRAIEGAAEGPLLIFDDATGRSIDVDVRGSDEEVASRLGAGAASAGHAGSDQPSLPDANAAEAAGQDVPNEAPRGRGRPKLGVVAREVTLLPRHWEWLSAQPGGASVALRILVEVARRDHGEKDRRREAQARAYHFMSAIAGDFPGFEEATRALFADDRPRFDEHVAPWPEDVNRYATRLAFGNEPAV
jgi:uncharacterized protein